jgi:hypothetical protein
MTDRLRNPKLAALIARVQGGGSVPSIGTSLAAARVAVERAEQALEGARAQVRAAARREGVKISGLFSESQFIQRATGERWRDEALEQGKAERDALYRRVAEAVTNPDPRFATVGAAMREAMRRGAFADILGDKGVAAVDPDAAEAEAAAEVEARAKDRAAQILAAAALRDSGRPLPEPTGRAKAILDAAREAHRKVGDDE